MAAQTVLVTGASGGIGGAAAALFAKRGYRVVLHYHESRESCERMLHLIKELGGQAMLACADVADDKRVADMFTRIRSRNCLRILRPRNGTGCLP